VEPRILLAGNAVAACRSLEIVLEAAPATHVLVVAPPAGPHHAWQQSLADAARARGVELLEPVDVNDPEVVDRLRDFRPDLALSVGYTQIFRDELRAAVARPIVNFHPALLPRHRGVAPLVWTIVEGDTTTGVTAHLIDEGVDTGPILEQLSLPIHPDATGFELHLEAAQLTAEMVARLLRRWLRDGELPLATPQAGAGSLHRTRDGTLNELDLSDSAERLRNVVRALAPPFPGATLRVAGTPVVLGRLEHPGEPVPAEAPGTIAVRGDCVVLHAADGALVVAQWYDGPACLDGAALARRIEGSPA
jgi:methionyl-tRNA formyltransferase